MHTPRASNRLVNPPLLRQRWAILLLLGAFCVTIVRAQSSAPLLLRDPSISKTQIAFAYAGSIWTANLDGSDLRRLTTGGRESKPLFSPDGSKIAFAGNYDGSRSVYVVSANGGVPRRLTYHPSDFDAVGWTPDGKRVLFVSGRAAFAGGVTQLFSGIDLNETISPAGVALHEAMPSSALVFLLCASTVKEFLSTSSETKPDGAFTV